MKKILLLSAILLLVIANGFAQKGYLRGKIMDTEIAEGLIGANIYIEGTTTGTVADFDGNYSLTLDEGVYTIIYSSISYTTITVTDVKISVGEVTKLDISMATDVQQLEGVEITAKALTDSDAAILNVQKKSVNTIDGMSSQTFTKLGDSNLSGAIKRVTGVSVESGKYVYVRGLGDRYTKTTLNGMSIPGLDPDKNSVQIDIFPTAVLNNVMVYKTFSPDLYGDFTGGVVNVETKDFPSEKTTAISVGLSITSGVQFNNNFILYNGGDTDWLGFDDGGRALPFPKSTIIPVESQLNPELERLTRSFNPEMGVKNKTALPSGSISFNKGNQFDKENVTFGYNLVLNYNNTYQFYDKVESNNYLKDPDLSEKELFQDENRSGVLGKNSILWSALISGALKFDNHSLSASILRSQNGESTAVKRVNENYNQTGATLLEDVLTYTQRSVTNALIIGKHNFDKFQVEWRNATNWSRVYDPDFRITQIDITDGDTTMNLGNGAGISRFYRNLNEFNESFKTDITIPYATKSNIKVGAIGTYKKRDFEILNYFFRLRGVGAISSNPDWFLQPKNSWTADSRKGTYVTGNEEPANSFNARQINTAAYAMTELYVTPTLRAVFGVRADNTQMYYTGQNNSGSVIYNDEKTLDEFNLLPSLNLVFNVTESMNLRGSFNQTLARPSFKEKSIAQIYDPITKRTFNGNINLEQTNVNNMDVRWEYFIKPGEIFAVSGFYKTFENHIENVSFPTSPDDIKPRNAGSSWVYGAEFEIRKSLDFITPSLTDLTIGANLSIIKSFVDMNTVYVNDDKSQTEKEARKIVKREGEVIGDTRSMAGQSPYLINTYVNYSLSELGLNLNVAYNVQGETLTVVGSSSVPDVYSVPFHSLSFNAFKTFGATSRSKLTLGVNNLLNDTKDQVYKEFEATNRVYASYNPGRRFTLKYSFTF
ncbi:MAG: TonB-dependent receptor [Cyclobacteriaceae bacterium]|nr:TonB-dependent receptor [Cyclobacteriaceae bacterium]